MDIEKRAKDTRWNGGCTGRARNLTGQRFGKLLVVEATEMRSSKKCIVWKCICDCGNTAYVPSGQLIEGNTKSCGCLWKPPIKEYEGRRFGQLTVLSYAGREKGNHLWRCRCDCGRETVARQTELQSGKTKSCGCLKRKAVLENMRLIDGTSITMLEASKRNRLSRNNTSGHTGVYRDKRSGKWQAQITFKGKTYFLGSYEKIEDAVESRKRGEEMYDDFLEWYYEGQHEKE